MKKVAYIIPGYCESHARNKGYTEIAKMFEVKGIVPIQVKIDWKNEHPEIFSNYNEQFLKVFTKEKDAEVYILGFSFGAVIAFLTASQTKPKGLILCSLSPYFEEDLKKTKPAWLRWWKKNFIDSDYSFNTLAATIITNTFLIIGEKEDRECLLRSKDAKRKIQNSHLYISKNSTHTIGQKSYLKTVEKAINLLYEIS